MVRSWLARDALWVCMDGSLHRVRRMSTHLSRCGRIAFPLPVRFTDGYPALDPASSPNRASARTDPPGAPRVEDAGRRSIADRSPRLGADAVAHADELMNCASLHVLQLAAANVPGILMRAYHARWLLHDEDEERPGDWPDSARYPLPSAWVYSGSAPSCTMARYASYKYSRLRRLPVSSLAIPRATSPCMHLAVVGKLRPVRRHASLRDRTGL